MKSRSRVGGLVALSVLAIFFHSGIVVAATVSDVKYDDVTRVLQYHADPTPADFRECGSNVDSVLADIISGRSVKTEIRIRAARSLGWFAGTRARAVLTSTMVTPDEDKDVRAAAMFGMARLLGGTAISEIKPWLKDSSTVIRSGAATALALIGGPRVRQILMDTISHEADLEVRMLMDSALNRMPETERSGVEK